MGLCCPLQRIAEKQSKGIFGVMFLGNLPNIWLHNLNCASSSLKILYWMQTTTTKNRLNSPEWVDGNLETKFFSLLKKLPYFSFWNLSLGFWKVVGVSITSDPSLRLKNLSLSWALASRNIGSRKDRAFDLPWKGSQTALQGASNDLIPLVPSSLYLPGYNFTFHCFLSHSREKCFFSGTGKHRVLFAYPFLFCSSGMHSCSSLKGLSPSYSMLKACICLAKVLQPEAHPGTIQQHQGPLYLLQSGASTCSQQPASPCTVEGLLGQEILHLLHLVF